MSYAKRPLCGITNPLWRSTPGSTGLNDSGDPNHPLHLRDRVGPLDTYDDQRRILLAKRGGIARASKPKIGELYLYDSSSQKADEVIIAKEIFNIADRKALRPIRSWDQLANAINQYSTIGKLVLSFHGYGGGLVIGNHARDLDQGQVKKLFSETNVPPRVTELHFLGCNIGSRPARLAAFGQLFGAKTVTGYTWFLVHQRVTVRPGGNDISSVRKALQPFRDYIIPRLNEKSLKPSKLMRFLVIYGASSYETATFPLSLSDARKFKSLNLASERKITLSKVGSVQKELEESPVSPFEHIVVTLR